MLSIALLALIATPGQAQFLTFLSDVPWFGDWVAPGSAASAPTLTPSRGNMFDPEDNDYVRDPDNEDDLPTYIEQDELYDDYDDRYFLGKNEEDAVFLVDEPATPEMNDELVQFLAWSVQYKKTYPNNHLFLSALHNWCESVAMVDEHNADPDTTFTMEANAFADLAPQERQQAMFPSHTVRGAVREPAVSDEIWTAFHHWIVEHGTVYGKSEDVEMRFANFQHNHRFITVHNKLEQSFEVGHNQWSALSDDEYKTKLLSPMGVRTSEPQYAHWLELVHDDTVPEELDWRDQGVVTNIKNQADCGSCKYIHHRGTFSYEKCRFSDQFLLGLRYRLEFLND